MHLISKGSYLGIISNIAGLWTWLKRKINESCWSHKYDWLSHCPFSVSSKMRKCALRWSLKNLLIKSDFKRAVCVDYSLNDHSQYLTFVWTFAARKQYFECSVSHPRDEWKAICHSVPTDARIYLCTERCFQRRVGCHLISCCTQDQGNSHTLPYVSVWAATRQVRYVVDIPQTSF